MPTKAAWIISAVTIAVVPGWATRTVATISPAAAISRYAPESNRLSKRACGKSQAITTVVQAMPRKTALGRFAIVSEVCSRLQRLACMNPM